MVLYYYESLSLKQIAVRIGKSESRAHQIHREALQRLAGLVAREQGALVPDLLPSGRRGADARPASRPRPVPTPEGGRLVGWVLDECRSDASGEKPAHPVSLHWHSHLKLQILDC